MRYFFISLPLFLSISCFAHEGITLKCHFENNTPKLYTSSNFGFLTGTNGFGDLEFAQKYGISPTNTDCSAEDSSKITEVFVWFGAKYPNVTDSIRIKIYSVHSITRAPDILLGKSFSVSLKTIDTSRTNNTILTRFLLQNPVIVNDSFYVSMVLSTVAGDTIGIMSNTNGNGAGKKLGWVKQKSGTWETIQKLRNMDIDFAIFPKVFDKHTNFNFIQEPLTSSFYKVFPNPVTNQTIIQFESDKNIAFFHYSILDLTGRKILSENIFHLKPGIHNIPIELKNLSSGTYFYVLYFDEKKFLGKLMFMNN